MIVHAASGVKKYVTVLNTGISKMQDANTVLLQNMQLVKGLRILLTINTFAILSHFALLTLWLVKTGNSYFIEFVCISNWCEAIWILLHG